MVYYVLLYLKLEKGEIFMKKIWFIIALALVISVASYGMKTIASTDTSSTSSSDSAALAEVKEVRAAHILVDKEVDAIHIRKEIVDGKKDFYQAAREYSKCPSGRNGGDLGWFGKGMMVQEFEKVAFSTPEGQVSQPVKTQFGWHIIKVIGRR